MSSFPLLRLTLIPLLAVLKEFDPISLYLLSCCSKKVSNHLPFPKTTNLSLSVNLATQQVEVNSVYRFSFTQKSHEIPSFHIQNGLKGQFPDSRLRDLLIFGSYTAETTLNLSFHLSRILNYPILTVDASEGPVECKVLLEIAQRQSEPLDRLFLKANYSDKEFSDLMKNLKVSTYFSVSSGATETFQLDAPFECAHLNISESRWVTLKNLMLFKTQKSVILNQTSLTNKDLDEFLRAWQTGEFPKLEYLEVNWKGKETDVSPILGFTMEQMREPRRQEKLKVIDKESNFDAVICDAGVDIEGVNGIKATMQKSRYTYQEINRKFQFYVWN